MRTLGRPTLSEALESLARQTRRDFDTVVVDMSRGAVDALIAAHAPRLSHLIHLSVGRRLNRSAALNYGIAHTEAPFISVLDDDNLYGPNQVATLTNGLAASGADLVYTPVRRQTLTPDGVLIDERVMRTPFSRARLMFGNYIYATATAYSRAIWQRVGGYDERFPVYEDWEFLIRVAHAGRIEAIEGDDAISRNLTGDVGHSSHQHRLEAASSAAGVFWTHRQHYVDGFFDANPELAAGHPRVPRGGYRVAALPWLVTWWCRNVVVRWGSSR